MVAGCISNGVVGIFHRLNFSSHNDGPGVDSALNGNDYQGYLLGVKAAGV
jgi:hypothetical protein